MSTDAMRAALDEAARSLETIAMRGGKDEFLSDLRDVAAYAGNRARVARAALAQPVSAERVPLTDEQIASATSHVLGHAPGYYVTIARAIERAHGITAKVAP